MILHNKSSVLVSSLEVLNNNANFDGDSIGFI